MTVTKALQSSREDSGALSELSVAKRVRILAGPSARVEGRGYRDPPRVEGGTPTRPHSYKKAQQL
jgi:hypothetical protein